MSVHVVSLLRPILIRFQLLNSGLSEAPEKRWSRFLHYAGLVKELAFGSSELERLQDLLLCQALRRIGKGGSLFSHLKTVRWSSITCFRGSTLRLIVSPETICLHIRLSQKSPSATGSDRSSAGSDKLKPWNLEVLRDLRGVISGLQLLIVEGPTGTEVPLDPDASSVTSLGRYLSWYIASTATLRYLRITNVEVGLDSFVALATIPGLERLSLNLQLELPEQNSGISASTTGRQISNLRALSVYYLSPCHFSAISDAVQFPVLDSLSLVERPERLLSNSDSMGSSRTPRSRIALDHIRPFLATLATSPLRHLDLQVDTATSDMVARPYRILSHFMALSKLLKPVLSPDASMHRTLQKLTVSAPSPYGTLTVSDRDISNIAQAWPGLRVLRLDCQTEPMAFKLLSVPADKTPIQLSLCELRTLAENTPDLEELQLPSFFPIIDKNPPPFVPPLDPSRRGLRLLSFVPRRDNGAHREDCQGMPLGSNERDLHCANVAVVIHSIFPDIDVRRSREITSRNAQTQKEHRLNTIHMWARVLELSELSYIRQGPLIPQPGIRGAWRGYPRST